MFVLSDHEAGRTLQRDDPRSIPLHQLLVEVYKRYQRPLLISETSAEDHHRVDWLSYVGGQARLALQAGVPLEGLCWYPIVDYPGWDNDLACQTGLWGTCEASGARPVHGPLADELKIQSGLIEQVRRSILPLRSTARFTAAIDKNVNMAYGNKNTTSQ